jgi:hypothetical protein
MNFQLQFRAELYTHSKILLWSMDHGLSTKNHQFKQNFPKDKTANGQNLTANSFSQRQKWYASLPQVLQIRSHILVQFFF